MTQWDSGSPSRLLAACENGVGEASEAFSRCFDAPLTLKPVGIANLEAARSQMAGAGLVMRLVLDGDSVLLVFPSAIWLPKWIEAPDPTGESKLATLAQELGMTILPEDLFPSDVKATYAQDISTALAELQDDNRFAIELQVLSGEAKHSIWMLGPAKVAPAAPAPPAPKPAPARPVAPIREAEEDIGDRLARLPAHTRSLLKIGLPVAATLAATRQPISRIVELGPGSILQFDKSCDQPITLFVNNQPVAEGEAVKVGEKFGLRITSMTLPGERFVSLKKID